MPTKKKAAPKRKSTAKKTAKKSAKKSSKSKSKKAVLVCANGNECFWTTDGVILSNLVELRDALAQMSEDVFKYHVTKEKNDFANWVEEILGDKTLAKELRKSRKPQTARTVVVRRLRLYDV